MKTAQAKGEKEEKQVEAKISDDERMFQANEWFAKGYQHFFKNELDKAIEAFTSAIALNPNYAEAYYGRGIAYYEKEDRGHLSLISCALRRTVWSLIFSKSRVSDY